MSDLKIDESRKPQDGRISKTIEKKSLDLRVSTLPTVN
jgi:type II secretory ATPase GspE/PulE/Tfp pilus assembly ATPase PilB-like protein